MNILSNTKTLAVALVAILTTAFTPAFAGFEDDKKSEIAYIGNLNESPVYRLSLNNDTKETFLYLLQILTEIYCTMKR
ncbi:hypothetical protein [Niabella hibiscisoli]|uniref:hypothetical protein n=1 Tax=Niabella hibiscisoli TaxID=1825928 RepID=UPI001F0ED146|nr:hypothetical protein [Niabella hibiscisoli]MCH5718455.1 hypothetical protein [Niabella hibiscisoli]